MPAVLSIELIDTIIFELDQRSDLLALLHTSRALYQPIILDQLLFCDVDRICSQPRHLGISTPASKHRSSLSDHLQGQVKYSGWDESNLQDILDQAFKAVTGIECLGYIQYSPQKAYQ
ncbi:hypothetical protein M422DRAFT_272662 [Sphaerobolus stellatus SS14]|uniref:F-box domain-containing protein n=1 Tax=Sphaerobolus stellatus (strain SS14) TaxID=990650 RepID=A0A0C9TWQ1_SPHS4|nr:hypothetical protein M422DRAFT_272662 [Sphaerobolus stellatus SS14]